MILTTMNSPASASTSGNMLERRGAGEYAGGSSSISSQGSGIGAEGSGGEVLTAGERDAVEKRRPQSRHSITSPAAISSLETEILRPHRGQFPVGMQSDPGGQGG
jgi:hypothetical protein